jgi:toxin YoeB
MRIVFAKEAWEDYLHWQAADRKVTRRIHELIKDAMRNPRKGVGKPEPLRHALSGYGSRRITAAHRMVYRVHGGDLFIAQLRYHYGD